MDRAVIDQLKRDAPIDRVIAHLLREGGQRVSGDQVAFRYATPDGDTTDAANPNGSIDNIAGVFNAAGTVLGLMPHPERLADARLGGTDGNAMFEGLVAALA